MDEATREAMRQLLREELSLSMSIEEGGFGAGTTINIKVFLGDEEITSAHEYLPSRDN